MFGSNQQFPSKEEALATLRNAELVCIDTETVGVTDPVMIAIAVAVSPDTVFAFTPDDPDIPLEFLSRVPVVFQNALFDIPVIKKSLGIDVNLVGDTMILAQSCGHHASLEDLSWEFNFKHRRVTTLIEDPISLRPKRGKTLLDADIRDVMTICGEHAGATYLIWAALNSQVNRSYQLDFDLIYPTLEIHQRGIRIDSTNAEFASIQLKSKLEDLLVESGRLEFNPASPQQVGVALSEEGFHTHFKRGSGKLVTDEEALLPLVEKSDVARITLAFRKLSKLNSTYYKPLIGIDRVHPKYHIVRTGRYSTSPQIQNIPPISRHLYLPEEECHFYDADMHQIEPRIMAFLSGDPAFIADVRTGDVYTPIAQRYGIPRQVAKTLLLATSYGAGVDKLATEGNLDKISAERLLSEFFTGYPTFSSWCRLKEQEAESKGYVTTIFGRKRSLESMSEGEYDGYEPTKKAVNSIVQGSGADILKVAILDNRSKIISAHIHDEILFSLHELETLPTLPNKVGDVEISWATKTGKNWSEVSK